MQDNIFETLWGNKSFTIYYPDYLLFAPQKLATAFPLFLARPDYALGMPTSHPKPFQ